VGGSISKSIRDRRATRPSAHFQREIKSLRSIKAGKDFADKYGDYVFLIFMKQFIGDVFAFNDQKLSPIPATCRVEVSTPELSEDSDMMSHDEFVLGYENGSLGCSVSALQTLRLFFAARIPEKMISIKLVLWSLGFLVLIAASVIGFLNLPVIWALVGTAATLVFYVSAFFCEVGELVLSAALANKEFYEFAKAKRALWIYPDDERNLPRFQKVVHVRGARRDQRRR